MSSGRHRRNPAPDETTPDLLAWGDPERQDPARHGPAPRTPAADDTSLDLPAWQDPGRHKARQASAPDETAPDLPAWREPARHEPVPHAPVPHAPAPHEPAPRTPVPDETAVDLPAWRDAGQHQRARRTPPPDETTLDLPAWPDRDRDPRRRALDETSVDLPAWDETSVDLPAWDEPAPRTRVQQAASPRPHATSRPQATSRPDGRADQRGSKPRGGRGALQMAVAAALVAVIGIGVTVYGLTTHVTVAGATYTPSTVGSKVPQAQPDPAALALSRSLPVKIQIPSIGVSAPIEQVGLLTNGEVQTPPLTVHNLTGWYKYGPTPGEDGASVILGHVDDYQGLSVFYYLKDLVKGDQIGVTLADGITANFVVDGLQNASKDDFPTQQVYGKVGYPGLRLITCGGSFDSATGHYDNNIIVYAHLVHSATT
ncbi:MAG TPA: class F sortase [Streptosporangiaceae bacterium]|nr:class F sortase [Streptosporangiaceae bacterium]